jgi:hypothetical protein
MRDVGQTGVTQTACVHARPTDANLSTTLPHRAQHDFDVVVALRSLLPALPPLAASPIKKTLICSPSRLESAAARRRAL